MSTESFDYERFLAARTALYKLQGLPLDEARRQAFSDLWIDRFELRIQTKKVLR